MTDLDKWIGVFYNHNPKKTNENYVVPKTINQDEEYYDSVIEFMDNLIQDLTKNQIDNRFINIAKEYKKFFNSILFEYYSGNIIEAYKIIEKIVKEFKQNDILVSPISKSIAFNYICYQQQEKLDHFIFYRARLGEASNNFTKDDLKHVPFNKISKIGSYRFSIPGQPCLYLGSTSYNCWLELGKPQDNQFNVGCVLLKKDYNIFNLSVNTNFFLDEVESSNDINKIELLFKALLLSIVTSYRINENNRVFKSEYIISQLVTLACKSNNIDGISYISKRVSSEVFGRDICMNLALFVNYEKEKTFSDSMEKDIIIGRPINYSFFEKLNACCMSHSIDKMPYEVTFRIKNIGDFDYQISYNDTKFYDYDKYLYNLVKNNDKK